MAFGHGKVFLRHFGLRFVFTVYGSGCKKQNSGLKIDTCHKNIFQKVVLCLMLTG